MKLTKDDLKPRVIEDRGTKTLLVPNDDGVFEKKECQILSFGLSRYQVRLSFAQDVIKTGCPTEPVTGCAARIEFDACELEELFKGSEAFQTSCPSCRGALGLIKSKNFERSFFFGWLP